jgi:TolB protein
MRLSTLLPLLLVATLAAALFGGPLATLRADGASMPPQASQQPSEIELRITGEPGTPPRLAVPDFIALTPDAAEAAASLGAVLWEDFNFEREFYLRPRDTYATVPVARRAEDVPFADWRELGADAVVFGSVQRSGDAIVVQVRLFNVRTRQSVFS